MRKAACLICSSDRKHGWHQLNL